MMDLSVKIYIKEEENGDNNIKEYIVRLFCDEFQCFGEPMITTCHLDYNLYSDQLQNPTEEDLLCPRIAADDVFAEDYKIAKELSEKRGEQFGKILYDLKKAQVYKNIV